VQIFSYLQLLVRLIGVHGRDKPGHDEALLRHSFVTASQSPDIGN
jgi:hypothetical protein